MSEATLSLLSNAAIRAAKSNIAYGVRPADLSPESVVQTAALGCVAEWVGQAADLEEIADWDISSASPAFGDAEHFRDSWVAVFGNPPSMERRTAFSKAFIGAMIDVIKRARLAGEECAA